MTSALAYFDGYRTEPLPANLLQAQRDFFGAHTYERVDKPRGQFFHTNWTGRGGTTVLDDLQRLNRRPIADRADRSAAGTRPSPDAGPPRFRRRIWRDRARRGPRFAQSCVRCDRSDLTTRSQGPLDPSRTLRDLEPIGRVRDDPVADRA